MLSCLRGVLDWVLLCKAVHWLFSLGNVHLFAVLWVVTYAQADVLAKRGAVELCCLRAERRVLGWV